MASEEYCLHLIPILFQVSARPLWYLTDLPAVARPKKVSQTFQCSNFLVFPIPCIQFFDVSFRFSGPLPRLDLDMTLEEAVKRGKVAFMFLPLGLSHDLCSL